MNVARLGLMDYGKALEIQERLLLLRQQGLIGDTLLMVEHPPVVTVGRNGDQANIIMPDEFLKSKGITVYKINRGGDVTYHGPGQIVGYPVISLENYGKSIKKFVWKIEEAIIKLLKNEFRVNAYREEKGYTGVWVNNEKITAIGIAVKRWVTMHGFAFNVNTDLEHFKCINPCGITDKGVTSLQKLLEIKLDFKELNELVIRYFCEEFGAELVIVAIEDLLK